MAKQEDFRGAESKIFIQDWLGIPAIYKKRLPKTYRIAELDFSFRKQRTIYEARILTKAKEGGVRTPVIYEIDLVNTTIVMEYIEGAILKRLLSESTVTRRQKLCLNLGAAIGKLHKNSIVHGDLTTSNVIIPRTSNSLVLIDFGLGYFSDKLEDFGIDLYLLERAIRSTHNTIFSECWQAILQGYSTTSPFAKEMKKKMREISSRGRYAERLEI
jgi:Kae1-associated kinase Bud32